MAWLADHYRSEIEKLPVGALRRFVTIALLHAAQPVSVDDIAEQSGVSRQYIGRLCRQSNLMPPLWFVSGARLVAAAKQLDYVDANASRVAATLRFGVASDLYNMYRRYTGFSVPQLRERGIWTYMETLYRDGLHGKLDSSGRRSTSVELPIDVMRSRVNIVEFPLR